MEIFFIFLIVYVFSVICWIILNYLEMRKWDVITIGDILGFGYYGDAFIFYMPFINTLFLIFHFAERFLTFIRICINKIFSFKIKNKKKSV